MSYELYKVFHLFGFACLLMGLGILTAHFSIGGAGKKGSLRLLGFIAHGVGLSFLIVSGFGLLARLGYLSSMPNWVMGKLAIWLTLGGAISLTKRKPHWNILLVPAIIVLVTIAIYLAIYKPGSTWWSRL